MPETKAATKRLTRSQRLLNAIGDAERVLVVTHDNPDPDAIASSWAVAALVREKLNRTARVVAGGAVVRAENKRLVSLLKPPIELVNGVKIDGQHAAIFVDCDPTAANHLANDLPVAPLAVIDHHPHQRRRRKVKFRDIRPRLAASATIVGQYMREQEVEPSSDLATAMLYAIQTDALGWPTFTRTDHRIVSWLSHYVDFQKLGEIRAAPLERQYYADLLLAMQSTFIYGRTAMCFLPQASGTEIVGEVADLLIRCHDFDRVLCAAVVAGDVVLSVRSTTDGGDAVEIVHKLVEGLGHGGGHAHRAGGKIGDSARSSKVSEDLQSELRSRWMAICKLDQQRGTRLVAKKEILEALE